MIVNGKSKHTGESVRLAAVKEAVRKRDGYCCTECGMTRDEHLAEYGRDLEVHRVTPGSDYVCDPSCQTLCRRCHGPKPRRPNGTSPVATVRLPWDLVCKMKAVAAFRGERFFDYLNRIIREVLPPPP